MSTNYIANIPKLRGRENYEEWCFAVQNLLVLEGMASAITQALPASCTAVQLTEDAKAKAKIVLTIDPSLYVHIKYATTTYELWSKLKNMFDDTGYTRKIGLLRKLINIRLENCDSMTQYVTQIIETGQRLQGTGFKITDEWIGALMLAGLPEKYSPMLMAIEHSGIEISSDIIKTKLMDMCSDVEFETASGSENAFIAKGGQRLKSSNTKNDHKQSVNNTTKAVKIIKCYKCKQTGHFKNKCPFNDNSSVINKRKQSNAFSAIFLSGKFNCNDWYIDSGASQHMTARKDNIKNTSYQHETKEVIVANQTCVPVLCSGDVNIITVVNDVEYDVTVSNVLCIPNLATNLLSVSQLIENGNSVVFKENVCYIYNQQKELVGIAELVEGVYRLYTKKSEQMMAAVAIASSEIWHRRLGHINSVSLDKMKDGAVTGISVKDKVVINKGTCTVCCEGKQSRLPFGHKGTRSSEPLDIVHADVCGPMECSSIAGSKYFLIFIDDYSRMVFVYFLKAKSETFKYFKEFKSMAENQKGRKIKVLRTDNGLEFCSNEFEHFLKDAGIVHQKTNVYTPQQNGLSERMNRSLVEKARCLIFDAGLHKKFWAEAINTSVYLRNRSVVTGLNNLTPYELWTGNKPDLSHIRIFGSKVMTLIPKEKRLKWDKKAKELVLVGYADNIKGYRIYNPENNSIITSRDIIIMENSKENTVDISVECKGSTEEQTCEDKKSTATDSTDSEADHDDSDKTYVPVDTGTSDDSFFDGTSEPDITPVNLNNEETTTKRNRKAPDRYGYNHLCVVEPEDYSEKTITLQEALNGPESHFWRGSMEEELKSFKKNDAWELVDRPQDATIVQCKWVFKKKYDGAGNVRYRARLVAKGFSQKEGVDYQETFSPVLRYSTLRLLFSVAAKLSLDIRHLDVTTAFLNGHLNETVYMQKPVTYETNSGDNKVLKLKRAIYGLKQSSRAWYQRVNDYLINLGFQKSKYEPCLFTKFKGNVKVIIALFVDDFFVFSNCVMSTNDLIDKLGCKFEIKDLGQINQCLGLRVNIKNNVITVDQEQYVENLLKKFNMSHCKTADTPMEINLKLEKSQNSCCDNNYPYRQLLGSLMYLAVLTRPDIAYSVNYLSQFNNSYDEKHWKHAKRVLKYLKGTKNLGLVFSKDESYIKGYVDADWGSDINDRKSFSGFCFKMSQTVVSFECRKQRNVALSSTEAEYIAMSEASKEAIYLKNLLFEITGISEPIVLYNDCQSAQKLVLNPIFHRRSKHIDIKYHFIREAVGNNLVKIDYLETSEMPADILTKSLGSVKHKYFTTKLGILPVSQYL